MAHRTRAESEDSAVRLSELLQGPIFAAPPEPIVDFLEAQRLAGFAYAALARDDVSPPRLAHAYLRQWAQNERSLRQLGELSDAFAGADVAHGGWR